MLFPSCASLSVLLTQNLASTVLWGSPRLAKVRQSKALLSEETKIPPGNPRPWLSSPLGPAEGQAVSHEPGAGLADRGA